MNTQDSPRMMLYRRFAALFALVALAACASDDPEIAYVERPVEQLYLEAHDTLEKRRYDEAAARFDEVERQHPYSEWARRSMLMAAFANYQANRYNEAIADAERFINLHPGNQSAPYAYYLIAQCHFERILDVGRDQGHTQRALDALQQVVRRYPDSDYARDARLKIDMTRDQLAGKEMSVGRFYLQNGQTLAAINRFKAVINDYETTTHTPEAMHRLVESYVSLGVNEEARQVASVLGYNYPGSPWYEDSYELLTDRGIAAPDANAPDGRRDGNFLTRAFGRIF